MTDLSWINTMNDQQRNEFRARIDSSNMSQADKDWYNSVLNDAAQRQAAAVDLSWLNNLTEFERNTLAQRIADDQRRASTTPEPTQEQRDAMATMRSQLDIYGLGSLAQPLWDFIVKEGQPNDATLWQWIEARPEFHQRFPAFKALQDKKRAITPAQYLQLEQYYAQVMRGSGMPTQYFDNPTDFTQLIANEVSPAEFQERIEKGYRRVSQANPEVRRAFSNYFGAEGDAALAAMFIDIDKSAPALSRMADVADISGAMMQQNVNIDLNYATRLAEAGVSAQQASEAARRLVSTRALLEAGVMETDIKALYNEPQSISATGDSMSATEQLGIEVFGGLNAQAQKDIGLRLNQRKATTQGERTQIVTTKSGQTSLGTPNV